MIKIKEFLKKEAVLVTSMVLAFISCFFVKPSKEYLDYIDLRTLAILFGLMAIMAGFQNLGVFKRLAEGLLNKVTTKRGMVFILVFLCFFSSMLITNDVALITFVPFTFTTLNLLSPEERARYTIPVISLQTIAANLGSMLTPLGNPQNLYLYGLMDTSFESFVGLMLPYTIISFVLIFILIIVITAKDKEKEKEKAKKQEYVPRQGFFTVTLTELFARTQTKYHSILILYMMLFIVALLSVLRILPWQIFFFITLILVLIADRKTLKNIDYSLLFTFVAFFIFIGNMGRVESFSKLLSKLINNHEVITSVLSSQVISNVPAALLLSGFTDNYSALVIGTNLGGLGTLIASMASLISYKMVAKNEEVSTSEYFRWFTVSNIVFLIILLAGYLLLKEI